MSYIKRETALEFVMSTVPHINGETTIKCVERAIKEAPAADVVEVVRCRDCKRWKADGGIGIDLDGTKREYGKCAITNMAIKENCFCSFGARKDTEERE